MPNENLQDDYTDVVLVNLILYDKKINHQKINQS